MNLPSKRIVSASAANPQASLEDLADAFRNGVSVRSRRFRAPKTFSGKDAVCWLLRHRYAWDERSACAVAEKIRATGAFAYYDSDPSSDVKFTPDESALYRMSLVPVTPKERRMGQDNFPHVRERQPNSVERPEPLQRSSPCAVTDTDTHFTTSSSDTESRPGSHAPSGSTASRSSRASDLSDHAPCKPLTEVTQERIFDRTALLEEDSSDTESPRVFGQSHSHSGLYLGSYFSDEDDEDNSSDSELMLRSLENTARAPSLPSPSTTSPSSGSDSKLSSQDDIATVRPELRKTAPGKQRAVVRKDAPPRKGEGEDPKRLSLSLRPIMRSSVDIFWLRSRGIARREEAEAEQGGNSAPASEAPFNMTNPLLYRQTGLLSGGPSNNRRTRTNTRANRGPFSVEIHLRKIKYLEAAGKMPSGGGTERARPTLEDARSSSSGADNFVRFSDSVRIIEADSVVLPD